MNEILLILKKLFAAYPNTTVDEEAIVIYVQMLGNIAPNELRMAVHQCICTCTFLPGVAEILETHHSLKGNLIEQTPGEAWGSVEKALRGVGSWGKPKFKNELTARVVDMMGWRNLCESDKPSVDRAQFMRMYEGVAERGEKIELMLPEVREYFQENVRARLALTADSSEPSGDGIGRELRRLGLLSEEATAADAGGKLAP